MRILIVLILSAIAGILYRCGGASGFNTKFRDMGIPTCVTLALLSLGLFNNFGLWTIVSLIATFGLVFGAQTSYFKEKGTEAKWKNWLLVGLAFSCALAPIAWVTGKWFAWVLRLFILTGFTILWSEWQDNVVWEESGRGAAQVLTLLCFLI